MSACKHLDGWLRDLQLRRCPERGVRADIPLHAALQALEGVRAVQEPSCTGVCGIRDGLAASWPLRRLQSFDERGWEVDINRLRRLHSDELLGKVHGEGRVLVLMFSRQTCRAINRRVWQELCGAHTELQFRKSCHWRNYNKFGRL